MIRALALLSALLAVAGSGAITCAQATPDDRLLHWVLLETLRDGNEDDQIISLDTLALMPATASKHANEIAEYLNAPSADVCRAAARCVWAMGEKGVPHWLNAAQSPDGYVRRLAAIALSDLRLPSLSEDQEKILQALATAASDDNALIRAPAAAGLCAWWPATIQTLSAALDSGNTTVRDAVLSDLLNRGVIYTDVTSGTRSLTPQAIEALLQAGPVPPPERLEFNHAFLAAALDLIASGNSAQRERAFSGIERVPMEGVTPQVIQALRALVAHAPSKEAMEQVNTALASGSIERLVTGGWSESAQVRAVCIASLAARRESRTSEPAGTRLRSAMLDNDESIRSLALAWFFQSSPSKILPDAMEMLQKLLADPAARNDNHIGSVISALWSGEISKLVKQAKSDDVRIRAISIEALAGRSDAGTDRAASNALLDALDDSDPSIRRLAMRWGLTLPSLHPESITPQVAGLLDTLVSAPPVKGEKRAGELLAALWAGSIPSLLEGAHSKDAGVRAICIAALSKRNDVGSNEPVQSAMRGAIVDSDAAVRDEALDWALAQPKAIPRAITAQIIDLLRDLVSDPRPQDRTVAAKLITALWSGSISGVAAQAKSENPAVRTICVAALANWPDAMKSEAAIGVLDAAVVDPDESVRAAALKWAGSFTSSDAKLRSALASLVTSTDPDYDKNASIRTTALELLGKFAADASKTVPVLRQALRDPDPKPRLAAIAALRRFGHDALPALDRLAGLLKDSDPRIVQAAKDTLWALGPPGRKAVFPIYVDELSRTKDLEPRLAILEFLASAGPEAAGAVPQLQKLLASNDNELRANVAMTLGAIGPEARVALPSLTRMIDNRNDAIRQAAVEALMKIAPDGKGLGPALMAAVYNGDRSSAERLALRLGRSGDASGLRRRLDQLSADDPDIAVRSTSRHVAQVLAAVLPSDNATRPGK